MICKNCANIFSDDLTVCPECDTPVSGGAEKKDIEEIVSFALGEFEDISSYSEEVPCSEDEPSAEDEAQEEFTPPVYKEDEPQKQEPPAEEAKPQAPERRERPEMKKMSKKEKGAFNFIISLKIGRAHV